MRLTNVTFADWLRGHGHKAPKERWLRELYPWPVIAQIDFDTTLIDRPQRIVYDEVEYDTMLRSAKWQPRHGTYKYRVRVESDGLGWHARSFADEFDICATPAGAFVTLFHAKAEEPLEKMARAFFGRRWAQLDPSTFQTLAVSRFLAAAVVGVIVEEAFQSMPLSHYPAAAITCGSAPMFADGNDFWIGHRFFSEDAYHWARQAAGKASRVVSLYFADTTYQFKTDLPSGAEVRSVAEFDATVLAGRHEEFIRTLQRGLELPTGGRDLGQLERVVRGQELIPQTPVIESDVHEALAALKRPCESIPELRYQLAAAVVLNAWIESERRLGFPQRKKFYAFKEKVNSLAIWVADSQLPGVEMWAEDLPDVGTPVLYIRIDDVDFSFHAIPFAQRLLSGSTGTPTWKGVRLKPIASVVLEWARTLRSERKCS